MDMLDFIIRYEQGDLDQDEITAGFQALIDSGDAWTLQGSYGRMAMRLIEAGYCHPAKPAEGNHQCD